MTRLINAIDADTAKRIRDAIAGKPQLREAKPKKAEPVKCYVSQFHKFDPRTNAHTVQLPIAFRTAEYNAGRTPDGLRARWVKEKREAVWLAMSAYFPNMRAGNVSLKRIKKADLEYCAPSYVRFLPDDEVAVKRFCERARSMRERSRVRHMEFVRIGSKAMDRKDNLRAAFKAIVDAICSFLRWGIDAREHIRAIGFADDYLEKRGMTWDYHQQKCPSNPRLYGIQIKLHCAPRTSE